MSQIIKIHVSYDQRDKIKALSPEAYAEIRTIADLDLPEKVEEMPSWYDMNFTGIMEDVSLLTKHGIEVRISRVRGILALSLPDITKLNIPVPTAEQSQIVNITIPNAGLFSVRTVRVVDDSCTDLLQRWLDDDWRIVAVCPPNDTRRPTYIVGHADIGRKDP